MSFLIWKRINRIYRLLPFYCWDCLWFPSSVVWLCRFCYWKLWAIWLGEGWPSGKLWSCLLLCMLLRLYFILKSIWWFCIFYKSIHLKSVGTARATVTFVCVIGSNLMWWMVLNSKKWFRLNRNVNTVMMMIVPYPLLLGIYLQ